MKIQQEKINNEICKEIHLNKNVKVNYIQC